MTEEIVIKISPDGSEVSAEGHNFKGEVCEKAVTEIINDLGSVAKSERKPEYSMLSGSAGCKVRGC